MSNDRPSPVEQARADEANRQKAQAAAVAKSDAEYAKATITDKDADGQPTRSVPSSLPPVKDKP